MSLSAFEDTRIFVFTKNVIELRMISEFKKIILEFRRRLIKKYKCKQIKLK